MVHSILDKPAVRMMKRTIVPCAGGLTFRKALEITKEEGGLPSLRFHQRILRDTEDWRADDSLNTYYSNGAWTREILVHPEKGKQFRKGSNVVDSFVDEEGLHWTLPHSYIPLEAFDIKNPALVVIPEKFYVRNDSLIVIPKIPIFVVDGFVQDAMQQGVADILTGVPVEINTENEKQIQEDRKISICRIDSEAVRPLICGIVSDDDTHYRPTIDADYGRGMGYWAGTVQRTLNGHPIDACKSEPIIIRLREGVTGEMFRTILNEAKNGNRKAQAQAALSDIILED